MVSSLSVLLRFFLGEAEAERGRETLPEEEDRSILVLGVLRRPRGMAEVRGSSEVKPRGRVSVTLERGAGGRDSGIEFDFEILSRCLAIFFFSNCSFLCFPTF